MRWRKKKDAVPELVLASDVKVGDVISFGGERSARWEVTEIHTYPTHIDWTTIQAYILREEKEIRGTHVVQYGEIIARYRR